MIKPRYRYHIYLNMWYCVDCWGDAQGSLMLCKYHPGVISYL